MNRKRWPMLLLSVLMATLIPLGWSGAEEEDPPKLLGRCTVEQLDREPYAEWFRTGYDEYAPHPDVLEKLRGVGREGIDVVIFFGTWCGDSRREVPRMLKVLDEMRFPVADVRLIAVDSGDDAQKQSPGGEEKGLEIYRVPTLLVSRGGREVARIVEFPVLSIERDLLAILSGGDYRPNYASYPLVRRWLREGLLADDNVNPRGLANEVRSLISGESELHAAARVLLARGQIDEAVKLFRVNCALHRESARCQAALAEALLRAGQTERAHDAVEKAIELNRDPEQTQALVELLERTLE